MHNIQLIYIFFFVEPSLEKASSGDKLCKVLNTTLAFNKHIKTYYNMNMFITYVVIYKG